MDAALRRGVGVGRRRGSALLEGDAAWAARAQEGEPEASAGTDGLDGEAASIGARPRR